MKIHLFRHGQVAGPAALYGKTDIELSAAGWESLALATQNLPPPDLIIASPLKRCQSIASSKAKALGCPLAIVDDFREMDFGDWDGVPYSEDSPYWPDMKRFWHQPAIDTPPGGESLQHMQTRVAAAWHALVADDHETVWVFTHGGVIRLILAELLDLDWQNPSLYSVLQIKYASRTDISCQRFDEVTMTRVQSIGVCASSPLLHNARGYADNKAQPS